MEVNPALANQANGPACPSGGSIPKGSLPMGFKCSEENTIFVRHFDCKKLVLFFIIVCGSKIFYEIIKHMDFSGFMIIEVLYSPLICISSLGNSSKSSSALFVIRAPTSGGARPISSAASRAA